MPQSQPRPQNYKGLAWVAAMALFMQSLDATILNTALPSIASDLHEPAFEMQMAIIAYSLSVALFIPLTAWAAAKFGTLTVFRSAVATFVLGSIGLLGIIASGHVMNNSKGEEKKLDWTGFLLF